MKVLDNIIKELESNGSSCFFVGGAVRDKLLDNKIYDYDIEVYGINYEELKSILTKYGEIIANDKFYIVKIKQYSSFEFSIPRLEVSTGNLHSDYIIMPITDYNYEEACKRRDFTVNAILSSCSRKTIIDPYNGIDDLRNRRLKHITLNFTDDNLRVLRAIRFSACLGFEIDMATQKLCSKMLENLDDISNQRFNNEFNIFIMGEYLNIGIKYFVKFLGEYFKLYNYNYFDFRSIDDCNNRFIRICIFFYNFRKNDLQYMLKRCLIKRNEISKIMIIISTDFRLINDFYKLTKVFSQDEIVILYKYILNVDITGLYTCYIKLKSIYDGNYFIKKGVEKIEISNMKKIVIIDKLKEYNSCNKII
ncbi:MAG: hypothetical protein ACK5NF_02085 [Bacilli bacterium]